MRYNYPHTIENGAGEQITFLRVVKDPQGDYLELENRVSPGAGPPMHIHLRQDESLTVVKGKMGVLIEGQQPQFYLEGQSGTFNRSVPHKFWNAGSEPLICRGWIKPMDNVEYFLTELLPQPKPMVARGPGCMILHF